MPKANLDRCWLYQRKHYGPGDGIEIPDGLYDRLSSKGYIPGTVVTSVVVTPTVESSFASSPYLGVEDVAGIGPDLAIKLKARGIASLADLANASDEDLLAIDGIGKAKLARIREA